QLRQFGADRAWLQHLDPLRPHVAPRGARGTADPPRRRRRVRRVDGTRDRSAPALRDSGERQPDQPAAPARPTVAIGPPRPPPRTLTTRAQVDLSGAVP